MSMTSTPADLEKLADRIVGTLPHGFRPDAIVRAFAAIVANELFEQADDPAHAWRLLTDFTKNLTDDLDGLLAVAESQRRA